MNKNCRPAAKIIVFFLLFVASVYIGYRFLPLKLVLVNQHLLVVEIAQTPQQRARGLQGRTLLADYRGMLFIFAENGVPRFWMKNTLLPLSVAFLDDEKVIIDIQDMTPQREDIFYVPKQKAKYALEVNRGWFEKRNIVAGSRVFLW